MLPVGNRVRSSEDFRRAFRSGLKAGTRNLILHVALNSESHAPRVGFVVSKGIGNAVMRNRVKRRLRAIAHERLAHMPPGIYVVRALPQSALSEFIHLERDFEVALSRVLSEDSQ
ncbi:ribonuclease P protein component [Brevibacterium sp. UMB1308A]|uniref:ribonuclease P protein component n=1 Tax=Brevibacterium sp. UMB1308A TaxID=3050608 RepID=UPI00254D8A7F|nr:ribonuclease P protein component [Brevibacterium sp. UMB1308A]MDK8346113.1 ribonuclease P protein component [Brevibacterium sp. UMB1308B]MDK8713116.1 ribonuclease P protein component [Brevibacterium sp. UMB1308A]